MGSARRVRRVRLGRSESERVRHHPALARPGRADAPGRLVQEAGVPEGGAARGERQGTALSRRHARVVFPAIGLVALRELPRDPRGVAQGGGRRDAGRRSRRLPLPARQVREAGDSSSVRRPRGVRSLLTASVPKENSSGGASHPGAGNGRRGGASRGNGRRGNGRRRRASRTGGRRRAAAGRRGERGRRCGDPGRRRRGARG